MYTEIFPTSHNSRDILLYLFIIVYSLSILYI